MNHTTRFIKNFGGKLFPDTFGTVRLMNYDKYYIGAVHDIVLEGVNLGTAKIVAVREFEFLQIRDPLSWLDIGMPAAKFANFLKLTYNAKVKGGVKNDTAFQHIIFQWEKRNYPVQLEYIGAYFEKLRLDYQQALVN